MKRLCMLIGLAIGGVVGAQSLPQGYGGVTLGMAFDAAKTAIQKNSMFGFWGDRDVSLLAEENRTLIETNPYTQSAHPYFDRCWFQFSDDRLVAITLRMNAERIDHYGMFTALCEKYGDPQSLSPQKSVWQNDIVVLSLERPLTIKYVAASEVTASMQELPLGGTEESRRQFLESF